RLTSWDTRCGFSHTCPSHLRRSAFWHRKCTCLLVFRGKHAVKVCAYLLNQFLDGLVAGFRDAAVGMSNQRWLIARAPKWLRGHIRSISFNQDLLRGHQRSGLAQFIVALKSHIASKRQDISALDGFFRDI